MKKLLILTLTFVLTSCVTNRTQPEDVKAEAAPEPVVAEAAPVLKRTIKDVDLKRAQDDKTPRKRVVVLPFLDPSPNRAAEILVQARTEFMNELNRTHEIVALDSSELKLDLTTMIKNGDYDLTAIALASQNSGASTLLEGKVIDVRFKSQPAAESELSEPRKAIFEIVVKARMINIRTGQELFNTVKTVTLEEKNTKIPTDTTSDVFFNKNPKLVELLVKDAFLDFSSKLAEAMTQVIWEGRIAAFQGEKIYLNVGQVSGLQIGDILKVVEDGSEVYDPEIGYHIGKVPGKVKGTLEVVGYFGQDGAVSVIHSGAGFKENDRIEIYE